MTEVRRECGRKGGREIWEGKVKMGEREVRRESYR